MEKNKQFDFYSNNIQGVYDLSEEVRYHLKILDSLDAFTRRHSENVAKLTQRLCIQLNMSEDFTRYCTICAYVHDIGKTFIPPQVLQKKGKLTDEEFEIMKSHTTIGYKMCHNDLKLRPFEAGPLYHHEALDGTGYPNGLIGNEIMIEGQIIRVADEFDAISSVRQYKTHIGTIDTIRILIENTKPTKNSKKAPGIFSKRYGKNNPKIVKALISIIKEDIEMEIYQRSKHIKHLDNEIKRYALAYKWYEKYINETKEDKKEYFKSYTKGYLVTGEEVEKVPEFLEDARKSKENNIKELERLKKELSDIKKMKV